MAENIEIIKGQQRTSYSAYDGCDVTRTEIYFMYEGNKRLILNSVTACKKKYVLEEEQERLQGYIRQIQDNGGRFYNEHWHKPETIEELLRWKEENSYTFNESTSFNIHEEPDGRVMFHGNFNEYSHGFFFVIYDRNYAESLMKRLPEVCIVDCNSGFPRSDS